MHRANWVHRLVVIVALGLNAASAAPTTTIAANGLGTSVSSPTPGLYAIQGGTSAGGNLFHSFSSFNLGTGTTADFVVTPSVANILARVTGGPSSIDGTITSTLGLGGPVSSANLFLINPAGVMFTGNALINLGGSFTVSTADYVQLSDGSVFHGDANHPIQDAGLTSAPVSAFGFLSATPAAVQFNGSFLSVNAGQGLHVVGGDVTLNAAVLSAPSGNLTIFSAASAGVVPFSLASAGTGYAHATNTSYGNVSVTNNSFVAIDGAAGGGHVVIRGGRLVNDYSTITAANHGSSRGGDISIQANAVTVQNDGEVETTAASTGAAGNISLQTETLTLDGTGADPTFQTGILSLTSPGGSGSAGSVTVNATGAVSMRNGGEIATITAASGGNVTVQADSFDINGVAGPAQFTGIYNENDATSGSGGLISVDVTHGLTMEGTGQMFTVTTDRAVGASMLIHAGSVVVNGTNSTEATGFESESTGTAPGGAITLNVDGLISFVGGGQAFALTAASAEGGAVVVNSGSLTITGPGTPDAITGIETQASAGGNAGAVTINTGATTITTQAVIASTSFGDGSAGDITIHSGSMTLEDHSNILSSTVIAGSVPNSGDAGSVSVTIDQDLLIRSGGLIGSFTNSLGNAGSVTVEAGSLDINGEGLANLVTGISDQTGTGALGNAGPVTITVQNGLTIEDGGGISSNTFSSGDGANVTVRAASLTMDGTGTASLTGISSNTNTHATGNGGSVTVAITGDASLTGGAEISSTTFSSGNSGVLTVNVGGVLTITDGGDINGGTASSGASGDIFVSAKSINIGLGSPTVLTGISDQSASGATGNAGSLSVDVTGALVVSDGGEIASGTHSIGNGGNVTVRAGSMTIDSAGQTGHLTGVTSETDGINDAMGNPTGVGGNAGAVDVSVSGALTITGGKIDTDTFCFGNAGDVTVQAGSLLINGATLSSGITGIFSDSNGFVGDTSGLGGNAGTVRVSVRGALLLTARGDIGAATFTSGRGGDVEIEAGSLGISGVDTGVMAEASDSGDGGSITVSSGDISLADGGLITASALHSNAGTIVINVSSNLNLEGASTISTAAQLNGGNITLKVGQLLYLLNSKIVAAAGENGGDITLKSPLVVLDHSVVSANAALGHGGDITIQTGDYLNNQSLISATGATNGRITITAPNLDLSGSLLALPADFVSNERRLRERCARSIKHEFSTLTVVGRNGTESAPNELQPDFGVDEIPSKIGMKSVK